MIYYNYSMDCLCLEMDARDEQEARTIADKVLEMLYNLAWEGKFTEKKCGETVVETLMSFFQCFVNVIFDKEYNKVVFRYPLGGQNPCFALDCFFRAVYTALELWEERLYPDGCPADLYGEVGNIDFNHKDLHMLMQAMMPDHVTAYSLKAYFRDDVRRWSDATRKHLNTCKMI